MGEKRTYAKPQVDYWEAECLDAIEATMSGGFVLVALTCSIYIPEQYGNGIFTYTVYEDINWQYSQGELYAKWLAQPSSSRYNDGIATYQRRWLIACTSTFGNVGDLVTFYLSTDQDMNVTLQGSGAVITDLSHLVTLHCIIADIKNQNDEGGTPWGHNWGQSVIEFEVEESRVATNGGDNPGQGNWKTEWGGEERRVIGASNAGINIL
jgi:hypothetical protein